MNTVARSLMLVLYAIVLSSGTLLNAAERPNVLFLISDDLSAEALSCYGNEQCETPNLDRLAKQSTKFTNAYCQFPICGPSRAAMMSGMYTQAVGVNGNGAASRFEENMGDRPSLAELFRTNGYYSARVSKIYHMRVPGDITKGVSGPDHEDSWTEAFNCPGPEWMSEGEKQHLTNENLKFKPDVHYRLGFGGAFYVVKGSTDGSEQPDHQAATKAIELLQAHQQEPFFLAVGFVRPHVPLVAPDEYFQPYPFAKMELAPTPENDLNDIPAIGISKSSKKIGLAGKPDNQKKVLSAYYASVSYMDAQVGRVLDELERLGLREDTIVVFKSDHGYHLGEHTMWQKMSIHEESARIPLLVSEAGQKTENVSDALVEQIDLYPTLAELAGFEIPDHVQGKSLVPILKGEKSDIRRAAYTYFGRGHLLRTKGWAYMEYKDGSQELYDMQEDPHQFHNLADSPEHEKTVKRFENALMNKLEEIQRKAL